MANITKTFIFPVPTVWKGQDQDDANVGVATYVGPKDITCRYLKDASNNKTSEFSFSWEKGDSNIPALPIDQYEVELDADAYPLHAAVIQGGIADAHYLEVNAGPADEPNPTIRDPYHLSEVYDMRSFHWDPSLNSGAGGWPTPRFASAAPGGGTAEDDDPMDSIDDLSFGWDRVRKVRNDMLAACDTRIAEDMPTALKDAWKAYRQKLRDLPVNWAGIGTATHLIVWPADPDETASPLSTYRNPPTV